MSFASLLLLPTLAPNHRSGQIARPDPLNARLGLSTASYSRTLHFSFDNTHRRVINTPSSSTSTQTCRFQPKCLPDPVKRLSSPPFHSSPALALCLVFNSMPISVCMLSEVVKMSSSVRAAPGDVSRDLLSAVVATDVQHPVLRL